MGWITLVPRQRSNEGVTDGMGLLLPPMPTVLTSTTSHMRHPLPRLRDSLAVLSRVVFALKVCGLEALTRVPATEATFLV